MLCKSRQQGSPFPQSSFCLFILQHIRSRLSTFQQYYSLQCTAVVIAKRVISISNFDCHHLRNTAKNFLILAPELQHTLIVLIAIEQIRKWLLSNMCVYLCCTNNPVLQDFVKLPWAETSAQPKEQHSGISSLDHIFLHMILSIGFGYSCWWQTFHPVLKHAFKLSFASSASCLIYAVPARSFGISIIP